QGDNINNNKVVVDDNKFSGCLGAENDNWITLSGGQELYCSAACWESARMETHRAEGRAHCWRYERGVCQSCALDTEELRQKLVRKWMPRKPVTAILAQLTELVANGGQMSTTRADDIKADGRRFKKTASTFGAAGGGTSTTGDEEGSDEEDESNDDDEETMTLSDDSNDNEEDQDDRDDGRFFDVVEESSSAGSASACSSSSVAPRLKNAIATKKGNLLRNAASSAPSSKPPMKRKRKNPSSSQATSRSKPSKRPSKRDLFLGDHGG
ncbi:unnamed protein product, partial [Amoebophrya sp. A25]